MQHSFEGFTSEQTVCMQGVASRDIKLENTLLDGSPRPLLKICDFGYSKVGRLLVSVARLTSFCT